MKNLRIHLMWFVVALIMAAGFSRLTAGRKEADLLDKQKKLEEEIRDLRARTARTEDDAFMARREPGTDPAAEAADPGDGNREESRRGRQERRPATPEEILAMLRSNRRDDRRRALREIDRMKDPVKKAELLREAVRIGDGETKTRAIAMFDELGPPLATQLAMEVLLGSEDAWVRARAARELSQIKDPSTIAALQNAFTENDRSLKYWSAKALQAMGFEGPVRQLVAATAPSISDPDGAVREDTVERLGYLGSADAIPYLSQAIKDSNSRVRREALESLGNTELPEAIPVIQQGLSDPRADVRAEAIDALYDIGTPEVIPILETALKDSSSYVVSRARRALDRLTKAD